MVGFPRGVERDPARLPQVDLVVDDHPLHRLAGRQRRAERRALLRVLDRHLLRDRRHADATGRVRDPLTGDAIARDRESLVDLAEHVRRRHAQVLELDLGRVARRSQRVNHPPNMEPGRIRVDDEARDPVTALVLVRARERDPEVGAVGAADELLRAVEDPVVAVAPCGRLDRAGRVAAARRARSTRRSSASRRAASGYR